MNDFDPGEGWRRGTKREAVERGEYVHRVFAGEGLDSVYWVRDEPVPTLPTEPWTVIRAVMKTPERDWEIFFLDAYGWCNVYNTNRYPDPDKLRSDIKGFEVLAEPKSEYETDEQVFERRVRRETTNDIMRRIELKFLARAPWMVAEFREFKKEFESD